MRVAVATQLNTCSGAALLPTGAPMSQHLAMQVARTSELRMPCMSASPPSEAIPCQSSLACQVMHAHASASSAHPTNRSPSHGGSEVGMCNCASPRTLALPTRKRQMAYGKPTIVYLQHRGCARGASRSTLLCSPRTPIRPTHHATTLPSVHSTTRLTSCTEGMPERGPSVARISCTRSLPTPPMSASRIRASPDPSVPPPPRVGEAMTKPSFCFCYAAAMVATTACCTQCCCF